MSNNERPAYERAKLVLEINHLTKKFAVDGGKCLTACNDINLRAYEGRTLGIIGESGCGKSTLVRTLLRIHPATSGEAIFEGHDLMQSKGEQLRQDRKNIQMVFQDPTAAFNPKMLVKDILTEPLKNFGLIKNSEVDAKAAELLEMVELPAEFKDRYPHSWALLALWHWNQRLSCATNQPARWTFLYRKKSASCCAAFKKKKILPICLLPMTLVW